MEPGKLPGRDLAQVCLAFRKVDFPSVLLSQYCQQYLQTNYQNLNTFELAAALNYFCFAGAGLAGGLDPSSNHYKIPDLLLIICTLDPGVGVGNGELCFFRVWGSVTSQIISHLPQVVTTSSVLQRTRQCGQLEVWRHPWPQSQTL